MILTDVTFTANLISTKMFAYLSSLNNFFILKAKKRQCAIVARVNRAIINALFTLLTMVHCPISVINFFYDFASSAIH